MRKVATLFSFFWFTCLFAYSQEIDYSKIILEEVDSAEYVEKLIYLAWYNYPENQAFRSKVKQAQSMVFQARFSWLNNFNLILQAFPERHAPGVTPVPGDDNNTFFGLTPTLGFGLMLNLANFVFVPSRTRMAKEEVKIRKSELDTQKLFIRAEVIRRYQEYLSTIELLKIHIQAAEDANSSYISMAQRFQQGEISLEEFTQSVNLKTNSEANKIVAEKEIVVAKAELEELIGVKLEEVK